MSFYDIDQQKVRSKTFSALEQQQANRIFEMVGDILSEHDIEVIENWTSIGRCSCDRHDQVFFLILLSVNMLDVGIVDEVKESLTGMDAELAYITSQEKGKKIQLVIEQHVPESS